MAQGYLKPSCRSVLATSFSFGFTFLFSTRCPTAQITTYYMKQPPLTIDRGHPNSNSGKSQTSLTSPTTTKPTQCGPRTSKIPSARPSQTKRTCTYWWYQGPHNMWNTLGYTVCFHPKKRFSIDFWRLQEWQTVPPPGISRHHDLSSDALLGSFIDFPYFAVHSSTTLQLVAITDRKVRSRSYGKRLSHTSLTTWMARGKAQNLQQTCLLLFCLFLLLYVPSFSLSISKEPVRFRFILMASSYSTNSEWQAGPPWTRETPLQALQGLQTLLNSPPAELQAHLPPDSRVWWIQCFRASPKKQPKWPNPLAQYMQSTVVTMDPTGSILCPPLEMCHGPTTPWSSVQFHYTHTRRRILWMAQNGRGQHVHQEDLACREKLADVDIEPRRRRSPQSSWCTEYTNQSSFIDSLGHSIQFFWWETFHSQRDHWDGPRCTEIHSCQRKDSVSFTSATHLIIAMQFKDNQQMKWVPRLWAVRLTWRCKTFQDYHPLRGVCVCEHT